jgi:hypothetical protein
MPPAKHPSLAVTLARNAAFTAAIKIGYSREAASEYSAEAAARVERERAHG